MYSLVLSPVGAHIEGFATILTLKRSRAGVNALMHTKAPQTCERLLTDSALERLDYRVGLLMLCEVGGSDKCLGTKVTSERPLTAIALSEETFVAKEARGTRESLATLPTFKLWRTLRKQTLTGAGREDRFYTSNITRRAIGRLVWLCWSLERQKR